MGKATRKVPGLRKKGKAWYFDTTILGYRLSGRAGYTLPEATAALAQRRSQIWAGEWFPDRNNAGLTIQQICEKFCEKHLQHLKSWAKRADLYKSITRALGSIVWKSLHLSDAEKYQRDRKVQRRVIRYKDEKGTWQTRKGKQLEARTVNAETNELMAALNWATKERIIDYNPIGALVPLPEKEPEKIMLDEGKENGDEWIRLYNAAAAPKFRNKLLKDIIFVQYESGMRINEVLNNRRAWWNLRTRIITLPPEFNKPGKKSRRIPISDALLDWYLRWESGEMLFLNPKTGSPYKSVFGSFKQAVGDAGLPGNVTSHALRRTREQIWLSKATTPEDAYAVYEAIGHTEKISRKHYTKVKDEQLQRLVGIKKSSQTAQKVA